MSLLGSSSVRMAGRYKVQVRVQLIDHKLLLRGKTLSLLVVCSHVRLLATLAASKATAGQTDRQMPEMLTGKTLVGPQGQSLLS